MPKITEIIRIDDPSRFGSFTRAAALRAIDQARLRHEWLGAAVSEVSPATKGFGWYRHFENGSVFRAGLAGELDAFEVHGAIRDKWAGLGWEGSFLGFPITDETAAPDGRGRYSHFEGARSTGLPKRVRSRYTGRSGTSGRPSVGRLRSWAIP